MNKQNKCCCQINLKANADFQKVIDFLKMIDESNRLKILCLLRHRERCVCEIWQNLDLPQNLVSHHLKTLKGFGLIFSRQEGRKIIYESNKKVISEYANLLNNFLVSNL